MTTCAAVDGPGICPSSPANGWDATASHLRGILASLGPPKMDVSLLKKRLAESYDFLAVEVAGIGEDDRSSVAAALKSTLIRD